jgi:hypothetical protein
LLAKLTQRNVNLGSDRFAMFNKQRDISEVALFGLRMGMRLILHKPGFCFVLTDLTLRQEIKVFGDRQMGAAGCFIGRGFGC